MELTGKCKEDFEIFQVNRSLDITNKNRLEGYEVSFRTLVGYKHQIWNLDEVYLNALIVDWFDTVGLTIDRDSYIKDMVITDWRDGLETRIIVDCDYLEPFQEWWDEAIIKANELYNESK
jgi:hypothetical protein